MSTPEWRLSGKDGCAHAFPAEDGYIKQHSMISTVPMSGQDDGVEEFFGPYDAYVSHCGHVIPVAMLMPSADGPPCASCTLLTGTPRALAAVPQFPARQTHRFRPVIVPFATDGPGPMP